MRSLRCGRFAFTVCLLIPAGRDARPIRSDARTWAESNAGLLLRREVGADEVQTILDERSSMSADFITHEVDTLSALASSIEHASRAPSRDLPEKFIKLQACISDGNSSCDSNHLPTMPGARRKHDKAATYYLGWEYADRARITSAHLKRYTLSETPSPRPPPPKFVFGHYVGEQRKPIKLVLGVISIRFHTEVHNAHRTTWMQEKGVCKRTDRMKNDCHVFPFLVFGNVTDASIKNADDTVVLSNVPEPENPKGLSGFNGEGGYDKKGKNKRMWLMGQFKTPAWFEFALKEYPWATHFAKMDADTFPYITAIYNDLVRTPVIHRVGSERFKAAPPPQREQPIFYGKDFNGGFDGKGGMLGEFYLMSHQTADCFIKVVHKYKLAGYQLHNGEISVEEYKLGNDKLDKRSNTSWPASFFNNPEDQAVGKFLFDAEMTLNFCPPILRTCVSDRWEHPV